MVQAYESLRSSIMMWVSLDTLLAQSPNVAGIEWKGERKEKEEKQSITTERKINKQEKKRKK